MPYGTALMADNGFDDVSALIRLGMIRKVAGNDEYSFQMYEELAHNVSAVDRGPISWDDPLTSHTRFGRTRLMLRKIIGERLTEVIFLFVFDACSEDTIKQKTARLTWDFKINWNTVLKNEEKPPPPDVEKSFWFEPGSAMIGSMNRSISNPGLNLMQR
nr:13269_t:CDS:2 [Entrophospora candida]